MLEIKFSREFIKMSNKCPKNIRSKIRERLDLFKIDPYNPILNNHSLKGKYKDLRSINITGDWRVIYKPNKTHTIAMLLLVGTHSMLYD